MSLNLSQSIVIISGHIFLPYIMKYVKAQIINKHTTWKEVDSDGPKPLVQLNQSGCIGKPALDILFNIQHGEIENDFKICSIYFQLLCIIMRT